MRYHFIWISTILIMIYYESFLLGSFANEEFISIIYFPHENLKGMFIWLAWQWQLCVDKTL